MSRILVIEDVAPLRNDIADMLRLEGYEVAEAEDGEVGLRVAADFHPDLVICDIMMPKMDGYGVLEMLRAQTDTRTLPFIFLTAKTERSEMRKGMGLGASDFLTKPFENDELIDAVRARLSQHDSFEQVAQAQLIQLRESIITALPHELRTPLNTIIGFSDMLNAEADNVSVDELREWSGHIQSAAHRLNRLIENYLTYVRIQALLRDPERLARHRAQVTAFPHITTEHQAIFVAQRYDRTADLLIEHGEQAQVCCAESDLTKMVDELLDNAFKFSKPGVGVKLTTQLLDHNGRWCYEMSVTDYGRGLRPEQIKTIGAYMQFDRLIYEQQGAGMGLAVAKGLCEMYLGHMHISSTVGVFTTVTVHLPVVM
jgi:signal transduction histidine kinase